MYERREQWKEFGKGYVMKNACDDIRGEFPTFTTQWETVMKNWVPKWIEVRERQRDESGTGEEANHLEEELIIALDRWTKFLSDFEKEKEQRRETYLESQLRQRESQIAMRNFMTTRSQRTTSEIASTDLDTPTQDDAFLGLDNLPPSTDDDERREVVENSRAVKPKETSAQRRKRQGEELTKELSEKRLEINQMMSTIVGLTEKQVDASMRSARTNEEYVELERERLELKAKEVEQRQVASDDSRALKSRIEVLETKLESATAKMESSTERILMILQQMRGE
jgi:hypothetical protein